MSAGPRGFGARFDDLERRYKRERLTGIISDARVALDDVGYVGGDRGQYAARVGRLEALLEMLARAAEDVISDEP